MVLKKLLEEIFRLLLQTSMYAKDNRLTLVVGFLIINPLYHPMGTKYFIITGNSKPGNSTYI